MTTNQLIEQLKTEGGAIVATGDCTDTEIAVAQSSGRFAADEHGFGYVRRPAIWLTINKNRELAHPNTDGRYGHNDPDAANRAGSASPDKKATEHCVLCHGDGWRWILTRGMKFTKVTCCDCNGTWRRPVRPNGEVSEPAASGQRKTNAAESAGSLH